MENTKLFLNTLAKKNKNISANQYSPLVLAYIGDSIFDVYIRTSIIAEGNKPVNKMHQESKQYVKASEQSKIYHKIENILTPEEISIYKRGRNAKPHTSPKNATISDYRQATGLESLIGYLYIDGQIDRLIELMDIMIEKRGDFYGYN